MTWFNHLTFFNVSTLDSTVAQALLSMGKQNLPDNTYYGGGAWATSMLSSLGVVVPER